MRVRYQRNHKGQMVVGAKIYTAAEHRVSQSQLTSQVNTVINRLQTFGYSAYIVGGAVRDLLLGGVPKDFDVVTDAYPESVRGIFRNSRIIGKRFRLVHIFFNDNEIIEVATFRALTTEAHRPVYGSIEEDAKRRDFTLNGLYYNPTNGEILDFVDGVRDIKRKLLRPILPLEQIFTEDPIRLLRCLKAASMFDFHLAARLQRQVKKDLPLLLQGSVSRLSDELAKILVSGKTTVVLTMLWKYDAVKYLLPELKLADRKKLPAELLKQLNLLDEHCNSGGKDFTVGIALAHLLLFWLTDDDFVALHSNAEPLFQRIKALLSPRTFANVEIIKTIEHLCQLRGVKLSMPKLLRQKWVRSTRQINRHFWIKNAKNNGKTNYSPAAKKTRQHRANFSKRLLDCARNG